MKQNLKSLFVAIMLVFGIAASAGCAGNYELYEIEPSLCYQSTDADPAGNNNTTGCTKLKFRAASNET